MAPGEGVWVQNLLFKLISSQLTDDTPHLEQIHLITTKCLLLFFIPLLLLSFSYFL